MGYKFLPGEPVAAGFRRILDQQAEGAVEDLADADRARGVHEARKRFKRGRSLLRLMRSGLGPRFQAENRRLRAMGHALAGTRETDALCECLIRLVEREPLPPGAAMAAGRRIAARRRGQSDPGAAVARVQTELAAWQEALTVSPAGSLGEKVLLEGLERSYRRGRKAWAAAQREPSAARYHEWRKRVKDLGYQWRLLERLWPGPMAAWQEAVDRLGELLGDDHDLAALDALLDQAASTRPADPALRAAIARSQGHLRSEADRLARRLYAEKPRAFGRRMAAWWQAWVAEPATDEDASG